MNDNIPTEHPKPPVELCLRLRDVHGFDQTIRPGDWYIYSPRTHNGGPFVLSHDSEIITSSLNYLKIPTDFQILDFVRVTAEKVFGIFTMLEWSGPYPNEAQHEITIISKSQLSSGFHGSKKDACMTLLNEIEKHRKVK